MRKLLFLFLLSITCVSLFAQVNVTFKVDMRQYPSFSKTRGVYIPGEINGWSFTTGLTDVDNDSIYEITMPLAKQAYKFKFVNNNAWTGGFDEKMGPDDAACKAPTGSDRKIDLTNASGADTLFSYMFNGCDPAGTIYSFPEVTFTVDVRLKRLEGGTVNDVFVTGDFSGWAQPVADLQAWKLTQSTTDTNVYRGTFVLEGNKSYKYKFTFNNGGVLSQYEQDIQNSGVTDRVLVLGSENVSDTFCLNSGVYPCPVPPPASDITFQVEIPDTVLTVGTKVWLISSFTSPDWHAGAIEMSDVDSNGVYEVTVADIKQEELFYKYAYGTDILTSGMFTEEFVGVSTDTTLALDSTIIQCVVPNSTGGANRVYMRTVADATLGLQQFNGCNPTGIFDRALNKEQFVVAPNPFTHQTTLFFGTAAKRTIAVYSLTGSKMIDALSMNNTYVLQRNQLESGFYFVLVTDKQGNVSAQKLIIE